ncbi:MAG: UDP-glucose 4-epimerase GalE [Acidobacteriota bacterium]
MDEILVTGGAGYIGSHALLALAASSFRPVSLDNLSEGHAEAVLEGPLEVGDLADEAFLDDLFARYRFRAVMHFASLCYVGESVANPQVYYEQNVGNALTLLRVMLRHGVRNFVLSSTCATYGNPVRIPIDESHPQAPVNPYGETKYFIERILRQYDRAHGMRHVNLRYFNAAGARPDGRIGEAHDPETHLIPLILEAALGSREQIEIYGNDYPTVDGTCIRDYIHVVDLAKAHIRALQWLLNGQPSDSFNLGTGRGYSVLEMVEMARRVTGREISVRVGPRRPGDPPELVADPSKARERLGWTAECSGLEEILETAWNWACNRRY